MILPSGHDQPIRVRRLLEQGRRTWLCSLRPPKWQFHDGYPNELAGYLQQAHWDDFAERARLILEAQSGDPNMKAYAFGKGVCLPFAAVVGPFVIICLALYALFVDFGNVLIPLIGTIVVAGSCYFVGISAWSIF